MLVAVAPIQKKFKTKSVHLVMDEEEAGPSQQEEEAGPKIIPQLIYPDDTKLSGAVDMPEGWDVIKMDLDKFEKWGYGNLMRFYKAKCKVLHLGWGKSWYPYRWIQSSLLQ
ncbi:hypothetical protein TURU_010644 [Turdus rufiventris]|nr:hypothetical protein TURU_010644 [Turdus rufiventris]